MGKAVLLVNLGTPASPKPRDVFRYLIQFLTDARVIDIPWLKRQLLVRGVIVPSRYRQSAEQYRHLWTEEGAPLLVHGRSVQKKLQEALGENFHVALAMRYQTPSISDELKKLQMLGLEELIILPLFPQYASATTGSVYQEVMREIQSWQVFPKLAFINQFYDEPGMIDAFCARAKEHPIETFDHILFSFHGLPERQIRKADHSGKCLSSRCCEKSYKANQYCYKAQCFATARAIAAQLKLDEKQYSICFQSRLGKEPWLQPYASDTLQTLAKEGKKRLLVFSPSFICDCLETTVEIGSEYQQEFKKMGGEELQLVGGLNDHPLWINALKNMISKNG